MMFVQPGCIYIGRSTVKKNCIHKKKKKSMNNEWLTVVIYIFLQYGKHFLMSNILDLPSTEIKMLNFGRFGVPYTSRCTGVLADVQVY